ncbi:hypothetical protein [Microcoleus sp. F4-D5]|uniref:hypothetical protein n=1 Tax=Microcoleus sp. F4-D5 TaxID=2818760 RepID=UPI002FD285DC
MTEGVATVSDRNTQYFKITRRSIALQLCAIAAIQISILIVMPRVGFLSRAIAPSTGMFEGTRHCRLESCG